MVFLDQDTRYDTSVADVARYLDKTPAQLTAALGRLLDGGFLRVEGLLDIRQPLPEQARVFPTADAMRTLPAFEQMSIRKVKAELKHLKNQQDDQLHPQA